jgi:hypothetical protein
MSKIEPDIVNNPPHYTDGGVEVIEVIKAKSTPEMFEGYLWGNVVKYIMRYRHKGGSLDLCKATVYLDKLTTLVAQNTIKEYPCVVQPPKIL